MTSNINYIWALFAWAHVRQLLRNSSATRWSSARAITPPIFHLLSTPLGASYNFPNLPNDRERLLGVRACACMCMCMCVRACVLASMRAWSQELGGFGVGLRVEIGKAGRRLGMGGVWGEESGRPGR